MTRDELIEKVALKLQLIAGDEYDYDICGLNKREASKYAEELLDTIFDALEEPTGKMESAGFHVYMDMDSPRERDIWQAMLSASPLVPEGGRE